MKLIILPGFSEKNKTWAQEAKEYLKNDFDVLVHEWEHWKTGLDKDFSFEKEIKKVENYFKEEKYYVLAKSVGTVISAVVLSEILNKVPKVIFCGIPLSSSDDEGKDYYQKFFRLVDKEKFVCIQNSRDPWGSFQEVSEFIKSANPDLNVIEKTRKDHNYPFYEDFRGFLLSE